MFLDTLNSLIRDARTLIITTHSLATLEPQVYPALTVILFIALVTCVIIIIRLYHSHCACATKEAKLHDPVHNDGREGDSIYPPGIQIDVLMRRMAVDGGNEPVGQWCGR
jgi:hypothetical protein